MIVINVQRLLNLKFKISKRRYRDFDWRVVKQEESTNFIFYEVEYGCEAIGFKHHTSFVLRKINDSLVEKMENLMESYYEQDEKWER